MCECILKIKSSGILFGQFRCFSRKSMGLNSLFFTFLINLSTLDFPIPSSEQNAFLQTLTSLILMRILNLHEQDLVGPSPVFGLRLIILLTVMRAH